MPQVTTLRWHLSPRGAGFLGIPSRGGWGMRERPQAVPSKGAALPWRVPHSPRGGPGPPGGAGRGFFQDKLRVPLPSQASAVRHPLTGTTPGGEKLARRQSSLRGLGRQCGSVRAPGSADAEGPRLAAPGTGLTAGSPLPAPRPEPAARHPLPGAAKVESPADKGRPASGPTWEGTARRDPQQQQQQQRRQQRGPECGAAHGARGARSARLRLSGAALCAFRGRRRQTGPGAARQAGEAELLNSSSRRYPSLPPSRLGPALLPPPPRDASAVRGSDPTPPLVPELLLEAGLAPQGQRAPGACPSTSDDPEYLPALRFRSPLLIHTLVPNRLPDPGPPRCHLCRQPRESFCVKGQPIGSTDWLLTATFADLTITTTSQVRYYYAHFTQEDTKAWKLAQFTIMDREGI